MNDLLTRLFGLGENLESVSSIRFSFAQPWAQQRPALVALLAAGAFALSLAFYLRAQRRGHALPRVALAVGRGLLLAILIAILADPVLRIAYTHRPRPLLYVLIDGTESMAIADELPDAERSALDRAVGWDGTSPDQRGGAGADGRAVPVSAGPDQVVSPVPVGEQVAKPTRMDYVKALVGRSDDNLIRALEERFRVRVFQMRRRDGVDAVLGAVEAGSERIDPAKLADSLAADGQVTNLSAALEDLRTRHGTDRLAGLVMISDFDRNAGAPPAGDPHSPGRRLGVPIYAVGVGPHTAIDLKVDLTLPLVFKKAEKRAVLVTLQQQGLEGRTVEVRVTARRIAGDDHLPGESEPFEVGTRTVTLDGPTVPVEAIDFVPQESGQFDIAAEISRLPEEAIAENNRASREVQVLDDYLRLLFVEYEPTWEWRFIKEVFHRDRLVGMRGFRTYLHSAHPLVKQQQELFTASLTPRSRSEFFAHDVIFLGDVPADMLTKSFCDHLEEFVGTFGGGLVVIAGPRFGPGQFARTAGTPEMDRSLKKIRDMLPVVVDPDLRIKEGRFHMQLTAVGRQTEFMRLGGTGSEDAGGWENLGSLAWYQPVLRKHPQARVLAEHPEDTTVDATEKQPLVAIRQYKAGQVVYLGFNETWRLRRKYGELYYRQFWGQLIHHLGFSHALGADKRFVVRLDHDQRRYHAGDYVVLTVDAFDENFDEVTEDKFSHVTARLHRPDRAGARPDGWEEFSVPLLRSGMFETRFPVFTEGAYRLQVKDPVTERWHDVTFQVSSRSVERRSAVRNVHIQRELASDTGGAAYELTEMSRLVEEITAPTRSETVIENRSLWSTWFCFVIVVGLMLGEWLTRKLVNLQ